MLYSRTSKTDFRDIMETAEDREQSVMSLAFHVQINQQDRAIAAAYSGSTANYVHQDKLLQLLRSQLAELESLVSK